MEAGRDYERVRNPQTKEDYDLSMQLAMILWRDVKGLNTQTYSSQITDFSIEKVSAKINGGGNGLAKRKEKTKQAYDSLK